MVPSARASSQLSDKKRPAGRPGILIGGTAVYSDDIPIHELDKLLESEKARHEEEGQAKVEANGGRPRGFKGGAREGVKSSDASARSLRVVTGGEASLREKVRGLQVRKRQRARRVAGITDHDENTMAVDINETVSAMEALGVETPLRRSDLGKEASLRLSLSLSSSADGDAEVAVRASLHSPARDRIARMPSETVESPPLNKDEAVAALLPHPASPLRITVEEGVAAVGVNGSPSASPSCGEEDVIERERELRAKRRSDLLTKLDQHQSGIERTLGMGLEKRDSTDSLDASSGVDINIASAITAEGESTEGLPLSIASGREVGVDPMSTGDAPVDGSARVGEADWTQGNEASNGSPPPLPPSFSSAAPLPPDVAEGAIAMAGNDSTSIGTGYVANDSGAGAIEIGGSDDALVGQGDECASVEEVLRTGPSTQYCSSENVDEPNAPLNSSGAGAQGVTSTCGMVSAPSGGELDATGDSNGAVPEYDVEETLTDPDNFETPDTGLPSPTRRGGVPARKSRWRKPTPAPKDATGTGRKVSVNLLESCNSSQVSSSPVSSGFNEALQTSNAQSMSSSLQKRMLSVDGTEVSSMYSGDDCIGFPVGGGGIYSSSSLMPRRDEDAEAERFQAASSSGGAKVHVPSYTGAIDFEHLSVSDNLEQYFKEQVFGHNRPSGSAPYMRHEVVASSQRHASPRDDSDMYVEPPCKPERIVAFFREKVLELSNADNSMSTSLGNDTGAAVLHSRVFVLTDINLYVVLDNFSSVQMFADAPLPVLHRRHSIETLRYGYNSCLCVIF